MDNIYFTFSFYVQRDMKHKSDHFFRLIRNKKYCYNFSQPYGPSRPVTGIAFQLQRLKYASISIIWVSAGFTPLIIFLTSSDFGKHSILFLPYNVLWKYSLFYLTDSIMFTFCFI
jgi:hypothetical protein